MPTVTDVELSNRRAVHMAVSKAMGEYDLREKDSRTEDVLDEIKGGIHRVVTRQFDGQNVLMCELTMTEREKDMKRPARDSISGPTPPPSSGGVAELAGIRAGAIPPTAYSPVAPASSLEAVDDEPVTPVRAAVYIEWVDSSYGPSGWHDAEDVGEIKPVICITVGQLLERTPDYISVALTTHGDRLIGSMAIPVGAIRVMRDLA